MPYPESFPWISAGLAVLALVLGLPGLAALFREGRHEDVRLREFPPALRVNSAALARAAASPAAPGRTGGLREWGGIWDGIPGAWPGSGPGRNGLSGPEA